MDTCLTGSNELFFDANMLASITRSLCCQSFIPQADMGDAIYEWMDSQVEKLPSAHLAEILRWSEYRSFVDSCFVKAAKQELLSRGHHEFLPGWDLSLSWRRVGRWSLTY